MNLKIGVTQVTTSNPVRADFDTQAFNVLFTANPSARLTWNWYQ